MIGELIRLWRNVNSVSISDLSMQIGVSKATLCRIEKGEATDTATLAKLMRWLFKEFRS
jgi:transcriptional regulator with XRE-family HTH domain